ncbi:MAG: lipopolysaccharide biosynthesis protein [Gammaproteobacteria bacterium]|nr:lipopolysaccharide biosynthesis protein [Gammaproteobacteria bacterium]
MRGFLKRSEFSRNVATVMSGNVAGQVIAVAAAPVITRLYTPEQFAILALYSATVAIIVRVGCLCYERSIMLPSDNRDAVAAASLSFLILICTCLLLAALAIPFRESIAGIVGNDEFAQWVPMVIVGALLIGSGNIARFWAMRQKRFGLISMAHVSNAGVGAAAKISLGMMMVSRAGGLVVGTIVGNLIGLLMLLGNLRSDAARAPRLRPIARNAELLRATAKRYRQFPLFATWNGLLNVGSEQAAIFLLSAFYAPAIVGFYSLSGRLLKQPIIALASAVMNVYFKKSATQVSNNESLLPGMRKVSTVLFLLGVVPFGILGAFGGPLFGFVFGAEWRTAGVYAQVLSPWFFLLFVMGPSKVLFEVFEKQHVRLFVNIVTAVVRVAALWLGHVFLQEPVLVIAVFAGVNSVMEIVLFAVAVFVTRGRDRSLQRQGV